MNSTPHGYPGAVPLYGCSQCGFVTTASRATAVAAHDEGSPGCEGVLDLVADFKPTPPVLAPAGKRRRGVAGPAVSRAQTQRRG